MGGTCRTIQKRDSDVEELDTVPIEISSWKAVGAAQRYVCIRFPRRELEAFIPLEQFLERGPELASSEEMLERIIEGGRR